MIDNPTNFLGSKTIQSMIREFKNNEFWKGKTLILASTDLSLVDSSDQIVFMNNGAIMHDGTPSSFKKTEDYTELVGKEEGFLALRSDHNTLTFGMSRRRLMTTSAARLELIEVN